MQWLDELKSGMLINMGVHVVGEEVIGNVLADRWENRFGDTVFKPRGDIRFCFLPFFFFSAHKHERKKTYHLVS